MTRTASAARVVVHPFRATPFQPHARHQRRSRRTYLRRCDSSRGTVASEHWGHLSRRGTINQATIATRKTRSRTVAKRTKARRISALSLTPKPERRAPRSPHLSLLITQLLQSLVHPAGNVALFAECGDERFRFLGEEGELGGLVQDVVDGRLLRLEGLEAGPNIH